MPVGAPSFAEGLRWCAEVYHTLKGVLHEAGLGGGVGDEAACPNLKTNAEPFEYITKAVEKAGFKPGVRLHVRHGPGLDRVLQRRDRHV